MPDGQSPSSRATAKSVSESPPRTASAARMNIAPEPGVHRARDRLQDRLVDDLRAAGRSRPRVRSRIRSKTTIVSLTAQPDDRQHGGQEHPVDRLARARRRRRRRSARRASSTARRPRRTSSGTGTRGRPSARRARSRTRAAPWSRSSCPRRRADQLVALLGDLAGAAGASDSLGCPTASSLVICAGAHGDVVRVARLPTTSARPRSGKPASATAVARLLDRDVAGWWSTPAAGRR